MFFRPKTTLFMLSSLDGKINSGNNDYFDFDRDLCKIDGVKEGLHQYYEIEKSTDYYSLNTGRVMQKIGVNNKIDCPCKSEVSFVIIDNKPHLNSKGINYLCNFCKNIFIITTNKNHIAFSLKEKYSNLKVLFYDYLNLTIILNDLYVKYKIKKLTIQSGGNLNALFLKENLIDYLNIVIAPVLIGGRKTSSLIDGEGNNKIEDLKNIKVLELIQCKKLKDSYIQLKYKVTNN